MKLPAPRSELYLRGDIANILKSIDAANAELSAALPLTEVHAYRAGFIAALRAVAFAFDVDAPSTSPAPVKPPPALCAPTTRGRGDNVGRAIFEGLLQGLDRRDLAIVAAAEEALRRAKASGDPRSPEAILAPFARQLDVDWP